MEAESYTTNKFRCAHVITLTLTLPRKTQHRQKNVTIKN